MQPAVVHGSLLVDDLLEAVYELAVLPELLLNGAHQLAELAADLGVALVLPLLLDEVEGSAFKAGGFKLLGKSVCHVKTSFLFAHNA